jgi:Ca2+-binding EF-hand superfamily protein
MNDGAFPVTGATNQRSPFSKNSAFTNDIMDSSKRHAEGLDDPSGRPAGSGALLIEAAGGAINARGVIARVLAGISDRTGGSGIKGLASIFRRFDDSRDKKLDRREFSEGLKDYGIKVSKTDMDQIFAHFDRDFSGTISFDEFLRVCRGSMSKSRESLVRRAFAALDVDNSGAVSLNEVARAYDASKAPKVLSGRQTESEALADFMKEWHSGGAKEVSDITADDFVEYYRDVSASIDSDDYFELMIRNAWHISGGEGASANTSCRRVKVTTRDGRVKVAEIKNDLGIKSTEFDKMRANLHRQGIHNVVEIELDSGAKKRWK